MSDFPQTLKTWRKARRFSQLDLAVEANVSSRHISFLETGRANPSPQMISRLGDALQLPLAARNQMLTNAGFAVRYAARSLDAVEMAPIRAAMEHTLTRHAPWPAIAIDRLWKIVRMNHPAEILFGQMQVSEGDSLLELMMSDLPPQVIENWPETAHHAVQRLRTESAAQGGVAELDHAVEYLSSVPEPDKKRLGPVVPTIYNSGPIRLSLFATIAQFGTPEDLTLDDLRIELYFPADDETDMALKILSQEPDQT